MTEMIDISNNLPIDTVSTLKEWNTQIEEQKKYHLKYGIFYRNLYYFIGIPGCIISVVYTSTSIVNLATCVDTTCIFQVILGIIGTTLFSLQTFLDLISKSEQHRNTYSRFGGLQRNIELVLSTKNELNPVALLDKIKDAYNFISDEAPLVSIGMKNSLPQISNTQYSPDPEFLFQLERFNNSTNKI